MDINVKVQISLSNETRNLLEALVNAAVGNVAEIKPAQPAKPASAPAQPAKPASAPAQPAKPASAPAQPAKPASAPAQPAKPASAPAKPAEQENAEDDTVVSLQMLRSLLVSVVHEHREEIQNKILSYGAENLTKLSEDKYKEMYVYLKSLKG